MGKTILTTEIVEFLKNNEFISIGTCDSDMQPNVAPKFLLRVEGDCVYLGDYNIDRTWANINFNPKVSLSAMNLNTLTGYQINGSVEMVEEGRKQKKLLQEFNTRKIHFSTKRVIEGIHSEKTHRSFEMEFPERVIIYKVKVEEVIKIKPEGILETS